MKNPEAFLFSFMGMLSEAQGVWSSSTPCGPWLQDARYPDHSTLAATIEVEQSIAKLWSHCCVHVLPLEPQFPPVEWEVTLPVKHGGCLVLSAQSLCDDGF